ncbi:MAG: ABC transporter ATP-binding protein [Thermoleophilia bacterium]|nr:ABC transporter ATP-binding protein [Thermoleophilia bacterium]
MAGIRLENITKRFGAITALDGVSFEVADGEFFAILGPPGAGKTTTLRTIVGLEKPDEGDVYLGGERVTETYPGDRDIAIVFQNLALYPDRTVFKNLAFPLKQQKIAKGEIEERVRATARTLRIEHLLERRPAKLSGGERQRVALGRAIVREPEAYLLDEPISALDALLRLEMRTELKRLQRDVGRTMIYVTHDQVEAMSMADRILVLREGVVQQVGAPAEIYHRPANRFVATVVGSPPMNFLRATASWEEGTLRVSHPRFQVAAAAAHLRERLPEGAACLVAVRPEDVRVELAGEGMPATIYATEPLGGETIVDLNLDNRVVKAIASPALALSEDQEVRVHFEPRRLHLFAESGDALLSAAGEDVFAFTLAT